MALVRELPGFFVAVLAIAAVPGPAVALILRRAALGGFAAGAPVVFGLESGIYLWILAAGGGLAAAVAASAAAYLALRVVGGCVLALLGVQAWRAALRNRARGIDPAAVDLHGLPAARLLGRGRRGGYALGLVTNVANPKAAVFAFAFYPQFIPPGYSLLPTAALLGAAQIALETVLYLGFALAVGRARAWFSRSTVRRRLDALSGTLLIALGIRVAAESR